MIAVAALVENGDRIRLSVSERRLELLVDDEELARRREGWRPVALTAERGYRKLFLEQITQADQGCDFTFLRPPNIQRRVPK
mgnify:FL=1